MTGPTELLIDGVRFPEAPRWHDNALWFSDMIGHRVAQVDVHGHVETVAEFEDMPGGLGFLPDGTPIVAGMHSSTLYAVVDGTVSVYRDITAIADGHLDDMVLAADGTAYVGGVGIMKEGAKTGAGGIIRVSPSGEVTREASDLAFPNGLAVSADGRTLLCNETFGNRVLAFDISDGTLSNQRSWADLPGLHPDGLCLDASGGAWIGCFSENRFIRVDADGAITDTIETGTRWATGVELGGPDGRTLFMTSSQTDVPQFFAGTSVGRIETARVDVPGVSWAG